MIHLFLFRFCFITAWYYHSESQYPFASLEMEASTSTVTAIVSNSSVMHGHEETSEEEEARMTLKIALSCAYILLFVAGTIGNAVVIAMIVNILTSMKNTSHRLKKHSLSNTNHVFIYVLGKHSFLIIHFDKAKFVLWRNDKEHSYETYSRRYCDFAERKLKVSFSWLFNELMIRFLATVGQNSEFLN